ncbi:MAG TPA: serine/threonine-protein kinase [Kofleriaceae bacterium]|nr:serine/threonine-protein kinase [Kofleriaceae bacterium]
MKPEDGEDPPTLDPDTEIRGAIEVVDEPTTILEGYTFGAVLGRGGIGEIVAAHDLRIGRAVAIKRLQRAHPTADEVARFMREARIQARLDHPAVPPVHEVGRDPQGRPYFTMKWLTGITLGELLAAPEPGRERLLRAFADVCLAIEFAHSRGIVHRDLKPSNIMIGDFGDVFVLDWGLARVVGEAVAEMVSDDIESIEVKEGELLGTPGYMSPEQLEHAAEAGRPADVYALGSILFELLAGEPLHPRGPHALASTAAGRAITSPGKRRPDRAVPPELDALCVAMLAMDPGERPSARRVAERVQAYLDGDRDVARRRTMAFDLVWAAQAAIHDGRRGDAMRAAGRALALDPEAAGAAELVTALMLEPPAEPPPELHEALRQADADTVRRHARTAVLAYMAIAGFLPIAIWNGIRKWDVVLLVFALACGMAAAAHRIGRRPERTLAEMMVYVAGNVLLIGMITRMAGPFTFVPALTCVILMSVMAYPQFIARPALLIGTMVFAFVLPVVLELTGALARTWELAPGELISHAGALEVGGSQTLVLLIAASLITILIAGIDAARIYRASREAQRRLTIQAWHLRQLLPVR